MLHLYNLQYFLPFQFSKKWHQQPEIGLLELSVAATGKALTVTVAVAVNGREQALLTLVRFKDVFAVTQLQ
jgi:hypothetical protein